MMRAKVSLFRLGLFGKNPEFVQAKGLQATLKLQSGRSAQNLYPAFQPALGKSLYNIDSGQCSSEMQEGKLFSISLTQLLSM
jgi:hypothetical protein